MRIEGTYYISISMLNALKYKMARGTWVPRTCHEDLTTVLVHSVVNLLTWSLFYCLSALPSDCTPASAFDPWTMPQCWPRWSTLPLGSDREGYFRQCHSEYQPDFKEKKKERKKSRVMGESPEYKPDNLIWKHLFVLKPTFHSLVYMYHTCALMHASFCSFISLGTY